MPYAVLLHPEPLPLQQSTVDLYLHGRHSNTVLSQCMGSFGPAAHKVLFVPSKSLFPQSCVSSGGSMMGLMVASSKRAYAIPRSAAPRAPAPAAGHC